MKEARNAVLEERRIQTHHPNGWTTPIPPCILATRVIGGSFPTEVQLALDELERLQAALADRYTVEREVGRGGMATVYLAEDVRHHRKVAVKADVAGVRDWYPKRETEASSTNQCSGSAPC